mmetsp:Transcript_4365/g.6152  ORF Transcript_4365/g.6152 Transcript_4365/m.6152 type:complete len:107 (-) Transcript_4365:1713-2033(-)
MDGKSNPPVYHNTMNSGSGDPHYGETSELDADAATFRTSNIQQIQNNSQSQQQIVASSNQEQYHIQHNLVLGRNVPNFEGWDMNSLRRYDVKEMLGKGHLRRCHRC